jgi:Cu/Zn superoxide dismutase
MNKLCAIAVFNDTIKGVVKFTENSEKSNVLVTVNLFGLKTNSLYGFHVHETENFSNQCTSRCIHFKLCEKTNDYHDMSEKYVGDLINISTNMRGQAKHSFYNSVVKLRGVESNIIGRELIIHECEHDKILKTSNTGKQIACASIGYPKRKFK